VRNNLVIIRQKTQGFPSPRMVNRNMQWNNYRDWNPS